MEDLSSGIDIRGDYALFIESYHFIDHFDLDEETKFKLANCEPTFFRVIRNGEQQSGHGWVENGEITQWG